jgi:SAM-dependent methyltransferase
MQKTNTEFEWDLYQTKYREMYALKSGYNDPTYYFVKHLLNKKILKSSQTLLEIGFGDGKSLVLYSKLFLRADGADISPENIAITKDEFKKQNVNNSDFFMLDLVNEINPVKKYDIVLMSHVLEHFNEEELRVVLPNIKKILSPEGYFIGAVPYQLPFNYRVCPHCHKEFEIDGHQVSYSIQSLKDTVAKFGFEDIITRDFNFDYNSKADGVLKKLIRRMYYTASRVLGKPPKSQIEFCFQINGH